MSWCGDFKMIEWYFWHCRKWENYELEIASLKKISVLWPWFSKYPLKFKWGVIKWCEGEWMLMVDIGCDQREPNVKLGNKWFSLWEKVKVARRLRGSQVGIAMQYYRRHEKLKESWWPVQCCGFSLMLEQLHKPVQGPL